MTVLHIIDHNPDYMRSYSILAGILSAGLYRRVNIHHVAQFMALAKFALNSKLAETVHVTIRTSPGF
jgi:hypothetical protein